MERPAKRLTMPPARSVSSATMALMLGVAATACADGDRRIVNVYAASSLVDVMDLVEERYEARHPDVDIRLNLAGTNALIRQINSGADAQLLVAADGSLLDDLEDRPLGTPAALAANRLTLVVPADEPGSISSIDELLPAPEDDTLVARCASAVPCGRATDAFLDTHGGSLGRTTDEPNVRSVLTKVATGEVDAGFVYHSDAVSTDQVVEIRLADAPVVTVTLARLSNEPSAIDLGDYLVSDEVAGLFAGLGFEPAPTGGTAPAITGNGDDSTGDGDDSTGNGTGGEDPVGAEVADR